MANLTIRLTFRKSSPRMHTLHPSLIAVGLLVVVSMSSSDGKPSDTNTFSPFRSGPKCNQKVFEKHFGSLTRSVKKKEKFPENQQTLDVYCK